MRRTDPERDPRDDRDPAPRGESSGPAHGGDTPAPVARGEGDGSADRRDGQGPAHRRDGQGPVRRREDHGPVRYGPPLPDDGLPVLPELSAVLAAAAGRADAQPVGGAPALLEAACGYWTRRGLPCVPDRIAAGPGAPALLLAITAALAGEGADILVPRPCAAWWAPYARLLGRSVFHVPTPAESGGVPDPYALLETVRRVRAEGGDPRLLVLSVADDPTATVAPPELLHETVEAATAEGLHLVSDETWRDTLHAPHETVLLSPAEMWPDEVTVVTDLAGALLPAGWPAAVARFPATPAGRRLHARVLDVLTALGARLAVPVAAAACYALDEPPPVTERREATVRLHARVAAAAHSAVVAAGALARPRRPAATCTPTSRRCASRWPPEGSGTPRTWRTSSPPGSACPRPAATASATTSGPCAYGSPPDPCWAARTRSAPRASRPPHRWNCPTCETRWSP